MQQNRVNGVILNGALWGPVERIVHGVSEVKDLLLRPTPITSNAAAIFLSEGRHATGVERWQAIPREGHPLD